MLSIHPLFLHWVRYCDFDLPCYLERPTLSRLGGGNFMVAIHKEGNQQAAIRVFSDFPRIFCHEAYLGRVGESSQGVSLWPLTGSCEREAPTFFCAYLAKGPSRMSCSICQALMIEIPLVLCLVIARFEPLYFPRLVVGLHSCFLPLCRTLACHYLFCLNVTCCSCPNVRHEFFKRFPHYRETLLVRYELCHKPSREHFEVADVPASCNDKSIHPVEGYTSSSALSVLRRKKASCNKKFARLEKWYTCPLTLNVLRCEKVTISGRSARPMKGYTS
ncbi:hypothetical protein VNO78_14599 [Psophocarpus tetragonolobus]|uniref:Uncharacterized protein n=1 Tax=Psophocarpus tetragonolobus TaxID=3891 RepID=A0AAN9SQB9_PSOTE